jgi:tetratricopeptide (TPR) repeat protein
MGIVHRDIKPSNLMVDGRGNLWITDFGLAQMTTPGGNAGGNLTMTGDLVGTLRYMSPEQALANRVIIDHRTDVYSLGVTLYEMLTLRVPFEGENRQALLRQIAFDEPRGLRKINKAIPAELETIVLKAMEKNAGDRYGTAIELGHDLRRFLEDKPIKARRPTMVQRARKWGRRHRAVVWAIALGLIVAVPALAGSTAWAFYKQGQTEDALEIADGQRRTAQSNADEAQRQSQRADENFRQAIALVDELVQQANKLQTLEDVRARQAEAMLKFFEALIAENRSDAEGRLQAAMAYRGIGHALRGRSECTKAADAFELALNITRELVTESPDDPRYPELQNHLRLDGYLVAGTAFGLGQLHQGEQWPEAVKRYREALTILNRFPDSDRLSPELQPMVLDSLAFALWALDERQQAESCCTDAIAGYSAFPENPAILNRRAEVYARRGYIRAESGRLPEAESDFREALAFWDGPTAINLFIRYQPRVRNALGDLVWTMGRKEEARQIYEAVEEESRKGEGVIRNNNRAWYLATCPDKDLRNSMEAVELAEKAVEGVPRIGCNWRTLGVARSRAGDASGAVAALQKSLELASTNFFDRPRGDSSEWFFLAKAYWQLGDKESARKWYDQAVQWTERNRPHDPQLRRFRQEAAEMLGVQDSTDGEKGTIPERTQETP